MNMIRRMLLAVTTALALVGVSAAPAQASWSSCPDHGFCIYESTNGGGAWYFAVVEGLNDGTCVNLPANWNNRASSAWNRAHWYSVKVYNGSSCTGTMIMDFPQNSGLPSFGDWNRMVTSYRVEEYA